MAIDAKCPYCSKPYRLKDDLAGKKVTCANQDCRKVFNVVAIVGAPVMDAETMAMAAFADEPPKESATPGIIAMACVICDHKWDVPRDMEGKNVLCPDCKHRQKVPLQKTNKPIDWKDPKARGPREIKFETLKDVTSARDTTMVSPETLVKTGVIDDGIEPVPLKVKLMRGGAVAAVLAVIIAGVVYYLNMRADKKTQKLFDDFAHAAEKDEFKEQPLARAALRMSGAEYAARQNDAAKLEQAIVLYNNALGDLSAAPKGADRDCLCGELAISVLNLGGEGEVLLDKKKLPWTPTPPKNSRAQVRPNAAEEAGVRGIVSRIFQTLQKNGADFDLRAWVARRLARELIAKKQIEVLTTSLGSGFSEAEKPEIEAQIALELLRGGDKERAANIAEGLVRTLGMNMPANPAPVSAQALFQMLEMKGPPVAPEPSASGEVSEASRLAAVTLQIAKKDYSKAQEIAVRSGKADVKVRALALIAETADAPAPVIEAAEGIVMKPEPGAMLSAYPLLRLAIVSAKNGATDKAKTFVNAIPDPALKAWATAEVLRYRLKSDGGVTDEKEAELPADPAALKELQLGHVWGRLQLARHNGWKGDNKLARTYMDTWPKPIVAPFGPAGVMLGVQDKELGIK
ncbi:hypothetical protein BH11PLA2_BH11PLA2_29440 [soil metagenome]